MKRMLSVLLLIALTAAAAYATTLAPAQLVPLDANGKITALKPEASNTLLSAVTSTGTGTAKDLGYTVGQHTCVAAWGGTAPTDITFYVEGSIDNSTFVTLYSATMTASPVMTHIVYKPVRYLRGNYVSKTGGNGTTSLTITCTSGGN